MEFLDGRQKACLFSPTGAGKTAMAATWANSAMNDKCELSRMLIVAPKLVAQQGWPQEMVKWQHLEGMRDMRVLGSQDFGLVRVSKNAGLEFGDKRATKKHLLGLKERVHVVSWDYWPWLVKACGVNWPYQGVIFDESSFLRDQSSTRCRAARHVVHKLQAVSHVLELTGTPNANHGEAIYAQIDLVAPGLLGDTLTEFRASWCVPASQNWQTGQVYSWKINPVLQDRLNELVAGVAVSVPSSLSVRLLEVEQGVTLCDEARRAYDDFERDWVWNGITAGSEAVLHGKLRQMASGFVYDDAGQALTIDFGKMERLEELVQSIEGPVLVAFEFQEELRRIKKLFGRHVQDIRETGAKAAFVAGKLKVLAVHPASAGHGVDGLQSVSNQVVWTTVPQDRELYDQLNGRLHRHGTQADTVFVHHLMARGTVEERMLYDVLPGKMSLQEAFLQGVRVPQIMPAHG
jgi:hypothetical protein